MKEKQKTIRFTREMAVRIFADAILVNVALLLASLIRFLWEITFQEMASGTTARQVLARYFAEYLRSGPLLTLICLGLFYAAGFYTYGRAYRSRYKVLYIAQTVSLAYLLFGFLSYFVVGALRLGRGIWVLSWILTIVLLSVARVWAALWTTVVRAEQALTHPKETGRIHHVLVIGGAGYIGSALVKKLLHAGYRVRILDLLMYGEEPIKAFLDHPLFELIQGDFRDVGKVVQAMQGVDAVVHLGAIVGDPACAVNESITISINLTAARMIAEVAKGSGIRRFVFASTCSVYGASDEILNERSALAPVSLYARTKIASERALLELADQHFGPTILRFGTIYGLSGRTRFDLVVNLLTAKAVVEGKITVMGADQWRPFVHVEDAALSVQRVLEAPWNVVRGQIFNVGSDEQNYTIGQVGQIIHQMVPTAELLDLGQDGDRRNYRVSFAKIRDAIDFAPEWTLEQGIQQVIDALKSGQVEDYRDARYSNVKFLKEEGLSLLLRNERENPHAFLEQVDNYVVIGEEMS